MKKVLAFNGSPRENGNTSVLLGSFIEGVRENTSLVDLISTNKLNLEPCRGCLRCNLLKRCSISGDDWAELSAKILESDVLVFAAPIYFHHLPGPMKTMLDRFRSFNHVRITEHDLVHTPWQEWKKDFVLLLTMGSPDESNAEPVIDLFRFVSSILGSDNTLNVIKATRVATAKQIIKTREELEQLYIKLQIPPELAQEDYIRNMQVLQEARKLGSDLSK